MRKTVAAAAMAASILGGAGAGIALFGPSGVGAQTSSTATASQQTQASATPQWITDALKKLVDDGTLNQSQADKVAAALATAKPEGRFGFRHAGGPGLDAAAKAIGIDETALRDALRSGQSIADVAKSKGVDVQKVVDAMVADLQTHLDAEVKDGHLTQAQADQMKANATQRITAMVNGTMPAMPQRGMRMGPGGRHGMWNDGNNGGAGNGTTSDGAVAS